ncbi:hypothetical protein RJ639_030827 [Escallonia herrerae]|uniref:Reverse transcriptase Ty1/copia-type domain-containing protein n=1 Tax=Escallonia herrerae TaxID=1293975 RepID=A0AA89BC73_9ASTE|nr:hypothetical protein RJ639_030827 [Escallonia herrerae]
MVEGLPTIEEKHEACEGCVFGKHHRQPFPKGVAWRANEKLELVHTDVDDLLFTDNSENMIKDFRKEMMKKYEMNDMGQLKHFLSMEIHQDDEARRKTELFCDNKSPIAMAKNPVFHSRTRQIALKYHFIREAIEEGEIELEFCKSEEQVADIFMKALSRERFEELRQALRVQQKDIKRENLDPSCMQEPLPSDDDIARVSALDRS